MMMPRYFVFLFVLLLPGNSSLASSALSGIVLSGQADVINPAPHLEVLEDPGRELSITQVTSPVFDLQFRPNTQAIPNFGRTRSAYWIRFTLENRSELKWYARINALLGYDVALHVLDQQGSVVTDQVARYIADYGLHAWSLSLPQQEPLQFYLRATNGGAILSLPVELFASDTFVEQTRLDRTLYASIIAALLIMAGYNLLSFFFLRETSYLTLTIHILAIAALTHFYHPLYSSLDFLHDTDSHFFTAPIYVAVISLLAFCRQLLKTSEKTPQLDRLLRWTMYISVVLLLVTGWIPRGTMLPQLVALPAFLLIILASISGSLQGYRTAQYFLVIFALTITIVIPNAVINVFSETQWQSSRFYSTGIATSLFLLLLSIVQSEKVREWREQKQRAIASREATNNFLMSMSHELRTPMHVMVSISEILRHTRLDDVQKEYLQKFEIASQHMMGLVNNVLDLGSINQTSQSLELPGEPFELQGLIDELKQFFSVAAKQKGLTLVMPDIASSCPAVIGNKKYLKQVLINLLDNSIKYTDRGSVTLSVHPMTEGDEEVISVYFEVLDTGIGIPIEQQAELFQPFYKVDYSHQKQRGSGLGLAISNQLVKKMGGELQLESKEYQGSRFFFSLELSTQTESLSVEAISSLQSTSPNALSDISILVVDDEPLNQFISKKILGLQGAQVQIAGSGAEAIQKMRAQTFDLVLMDVSMPDMDGYETTRQIRADKNISACTIIALTAHAIEGERERCLSVGMDDYLAKPFGVDELIAVILKHR